MKRFAAAILATTLLAGCSAPASDTGAQTSAYFDNTGRDDVLSGGVKLVPIETPNGTVRVWTKRVGNNPTIKVLLLHGGPSATHEYFEGADMFFPGAGVEYYYYDQLGSFYSDPSPDSSLWTIDHYVDEVEQVRKALGLDSSNFYLLGHSWGGILAMEYALAHGENLKGLIVSNMMASIPAYNAYAHDVLMPQMDQGVLAEIQAIEAAGDFENPRYMELLTPNWYEKHILRMPADQWPDPVNRGFAHLNYDIYLAMQGPSEMGAGGSLVDWDRTADLKNITVPTMVIGAQYDTMDPQHMEWMAGQFPKGRYLYCPDAGHMAMFDAQETYFNGVVAFLKDVDAGR